MKDPLAVMSMSISNMFGMGIKEESFQDDDDEDDGYVDELASSDLQEGTVASNINGLVKVRKLPMKQDPTQEQQPVPGSITNANSGSRFTRRTSIANKNDAIVTDTLRQQLAESNNLNEVLEKKVQDQHAKVTSLRKTMETLYAAQKALDSKVNTTDATNEKTFAARQQEQQKYDDDLATLTNEKKEALARVVEEQEARTMAELRLKEVLKGEKRLRETNASLLAAKDSIEDELRSLNARNAENLRQVTAKLEQSETEKAELEKSKSKLEKDLDKLQKRHAELRAASKKLLADRAARKESLDRVIADGDDGGARAVSSTTATKTKEEEESKLENKATSAEEAPRALPVRGNSAPRPRSTRRSRERPGNASPREQKYEEVSSQRNGGDGRGASGRSIESGGRRKPRPNPTPKVGNKSGGADTPSSQSSSKAAPVRAVTPVKRVSSSANMGDRSTRTSAERGSSRSRSESSNQKNTTRPVLKKRDSHKIREEEQLAELHGDAKL